MGLEKDPPPPSSKRKKNTVEMCSLKEKQQGPCKSQRIRFFCRWEWTSFSRHEEKTFQQDRGTQVWHSPPSGLWRASACYFTNTSSLFSAIQIHILHLQSWEQVGPMKATRGQTNMDRYFCEHTDEYRWSQQDVYIRNEELSLRECLHLLSTTSVYSVNHFISYRYPKFCFVSVQLI